MDIIKFNTNRSYYNKIEASRASITVKQLIEILSREPDDARVIFSNDGGYTYGYIDEDVIGYDSEPNLTSDEETDIDYAVDRAISELTDEGVFNVEPTIEDGLAHFDEIASRAGLDTTNLDVVKYAKSYMKKYCF